MAQSVRAAALLLLASAASARQLSPAPSLVPPPPPDDGADLLPRAREQLERGMRRVQEKPWSSLGTLVLARLLLSHVSIQTHKWAALRRARKLVPAMQRALRCSQRQRRGLRERRLRCSALVLCRSQRR